MNDKTIYKARGLQSNDPGEDLTENIPNDTCLPQQAKVIKLDKKIEPENKSKSHNLPDDSGKDMNIPRF